MSDHCLVCPTNRRHEYFPTGVAALIAALPFALIASIIVITPTSYWLGWTEIHQILYAIYEAGRVFTIYELELPGIAALGWPLYLGMAVASILYFGQWAVWYLFIRD